MSVFFRLMIFIPLLRSLLLFDEEEVVRHRDEDDEALRHAELLGSTIQRACELAELIAGGKHPRTQLGSFSGSLQRVFQRGKPKIWWLRRLFGHKEVRMVRLYDLWRPLWLGADGVIYRRYERFSFDGSELSYYCMEAEIWKRDLDGLRHILNVLDAEINTCNASNF